MTEPSEAAKAAAEDVITAITHRLSEAGKAKMDLVDSTLEHCRFSITAVIQRHFDTKKSADTAKEECETLEKRPI